MTTPQEQILNFLNQILEGTDCFLVEFKVKPTNNYKIYLDSDTGFTLEKCMKINRALRREVEESGLFPEGDISLEVSSPGVDAPLRMPRQFTKNIGRKLEIELNDPDAPGLVGKLLEVSEEGLKIEKAKPIRRGRKETTEEPEVIALTFDELKTATVLIEF